MDTTRERCPVCDREVATEWVDGQDYAHDGRCWSEVVCDGTALLDRRGWQAAEDCRARAIDWRTRALAAEARIREAVEQMRGGSHSGMLRALDILTREMQP